MMNIENYKKELESMSREELLHEISNLIDDHGIQLQNKNIELQELKSALARADLQLQFQIGEVDLRDKEIERLKGKRKPEDNEVLNILNNFSEADYKQVCAKDILKVIDYINGQKAEIERLKQRHGVALLRNDDLDLENYELKKQVDELKEENVNLKQGKAIMLNSITDLNRLVQFPVEYEGKNFEDIAELGNYIQEQAVKDTAKEIEQELEYKGYFEYGQFTISGNDFTEIFKKRGVEVE